MRKAVTKARKRNKVTDVYWTTKGLGWDWQELDGYSQKQRQPRGCRKSQRPGKSLVPPATATGAIKKRAPSKYNIFLKNWIRANKADKDQHGRAKSSASWPASTRTIVSETKGLRGWAATLQATG